MKNIYLIILLAISWQAIGKSPWLESLDLEDKQQQLDLRWQAYGGQVDLKFMYDKLNSMHIQVLPRPEFPNKHWDYNHLVFPISEQSKLELQMPYGNIEKVTAGNLAINSNFSLSNGIHSLQINSFKLQPTEKPVNGGDIVTFKFIDQDQRHLFTIKSVHIEYDSDKSLLLMSNMDLYATKELAKLLNKPILENQVVGQIHTYSKLKIPENAKRELVGGTCASHPIWPPEADVDVALTDMSVHWVRNIGSDRIIIAPSAVLKNVGNADVPWHEQFSSPEPPYNTDQHPFLNWSMYREIDGRFEQLGYSGVKHAFLTINSNCSIDCGGSHILWLGCEDVYGVGNNDSTYSLGPRSEIAADTGVWDNCGSFFDPVPCSGSHQNSSNGTDENRLSVFNSDLTDVNNTAMYVQAWYLIRDDINIFNSMGYRSVNPVPIGGGWTMNTGATFSNGAALDNYVTPNSLSATEASQTVETGEGQFTVAVKVVDLGGGMYRYNYAVENYEFDPRFISYHIPFADSAILTDTVFVDPEHNASNDWQFSRSSHVLSINGNAQNEQDWGMLFSFSFTTDMAPVIAEFSIDAAHVNELVNSANPTVVAMSLIPDLLYKSGFE